MQVAVPESTRGHASTCDERLVHGVEHCPRANRGAGAWHARLEEKPLEVCVFLSGVCSFEAHVVVCGIVTVTHTKTHCMKAVPIMKFVQVCTLQKS